MKKKKTTTTRKTRKKPPAVARRVTGAARRPHSADDKVQALMHELRVHAEEITVQNEQLLKAQGELEEARDRFADLYDFAPVGYLTLDFNGVITEINLVGASLLGRPRTFLIKLPLAGMIAREDRTRLQAFLTQARASTDAATSVDVTARTDGKHVLRLVSRPGGTGQRGELFTVMVDVTEERRYEAERDKAFLNEQRRSTELVGEVNERIAAEARVKTLLERLVTAQEEERRRIARNLHDHLGQQLTALRLTLGSMREEPEVNAELRRRLTMAEDIVARLDRDVDLLAWDLRPAGLDLGLTSALGDLVRQWTAVTEVPAEFHQSTPGELRLPPRTEANVYRIVQEALNNIAKHAGASHVSVLVEQHTDAVVIIIEDDGRGFDPERASESQGQHAGMGLLGMRERAALIDGTVQIESAPGQGTTVFIRVPTTGAPQPA